MKFYGRVNWRQMLEGWLQLKRAVAVVDEQKELML